MKQPGPAYKVSGFHFGMEHPRCFIYWSGGGTHTRTRKVRERESRQKGDPIFADGRRVVVASCSRRGRVVVVVAVATV